jgi:hypothetical protein
MVLDGQYKDSYLGSVNWGWSKQRQTNKEDAPVVTLTPPAITLASPGVPTANFQKAGMQWNKVMNELPPTVDKVNVFDEYGSETETTKENIPRNITYLPDQVEEIQPVDVAALTNTDLLARYRMLNGITGYKNVNQNALEYCPTGKPMKRLGSFTTRSRAGYEQTITRYQAKNGSTPKVVEQALASGI